MTPARFPTSAGAVLGRTLGSQSKDQENSINFQINYDRSNVCLKKIEIWYGPGQFH